MERRTFLKMSSGAAVAVVVLPSTGCAFSVTDTLNTVIDAVDGILSYVGTSVPWAAQLEQVLIQLKNSESSWQSGGAVAIVIDALDSLEAVLAVIPATAIYSPLIDLIVAGVEAILNYFAKNTPPAALKIATRAHAKNWRAGRVAIQTPHVLQSQLGAFKAQYNDAAIGCGCPQLKLK